MKKIDQRAKTWQHLTTITHVEHVLLLLDKLFYSTE